jgi:signal transduction histidine kinase
VRADAVFCERILVNLLHNAARHGAPPIRADLRVRPGRIELTVEDCGRGPDPSVTPRLFTPFAAGAATGGTGVGLALSRGFAEAQGGSLRLEHADARTRVTLTLPLEPVPEVA